MRWCLRVCDGSPTGAAGCGTGLNADSRGAGVKVNGVQGRIWSASLSARSAALRAAGFFAVAKREAAPCDNHPDEVGAIRHGTAATGIAEEHSVPEGQSKSEQAPIRRPPLRAEGHCTGARPAPFSFGPCTARFLFRKSEKKTGGASRLDKPPAGAESPWPPDGGPNFHGRFVTSLTRSRGGHTIGPPRAVAPTGARNGFTPARRCAPADNPW